MTKLVEAERAYEANQEASGLNAALLVFAAEYWERHDVEDYPDIPAAMVTAARAIAGDPSKVVVSAELAADLKGWLKPWPEI